MSRWLYGESVGQAVQQDDCADGSIFGFEHKGAVKILKKVRRIHRAAVKVPIDRDAIIRIEFLRHLGLDGFKNPGLGAKYCFQSVTSSSLAFNSCGTKVCHTERRGPPWVT